MKRNRFEMVVLSFLGALVILSLVIPQLVRDEGRIQPLALSVLFRDTESSGWAIGRQGMEQAADELGAELRFLNLTTQNDGEEQAELLRREAEGGAGALVVIPADSVALSAILIGGGVSCPVVALESPVAGGAGEVVLDNEQLGRRLAEALLEDWTSGPVLLLDTAPGCAGVTARLEAAEEALEEAGVDAVRVESLPEDGSADWMMTFERSATLRTAERKEAEGLSFALYGVGGSTAITAHLERGTISAMAAWSDYAAGYLAVRQAVEATREPGRELEPLPFFILRGEDIYAPEYQKLLFPVTS